MRIAATIALALLVASAAAPAARADSPVPPPCGEVDGFHRLDFWLGRWDVRVDGTSVGRNVIESVLDGCAVTESWTSAGGDEGRSLFYYLPATDTWKQVWVTGSATRAGGVKEKTLVARLDDGGLRFRGRIALVGGGDYLDRTTLTPLDGGRVRQHIEISRDDGATWTTTFDAVYVPVD